MTKRRFKPEVRKDAILVAACGLAEQGHYRDVTRKEVAAAVGVSGPAIQYHFGTMQQLRKDLIRFAIKRECWRVVAQAIAAGDPQAGRLSAEDRKKALDTLR